jgi:hypothetical protein
MWDAFRRLTSLVRLHSCPVPGGIEQMHYCTVQPSPLPVHAVHAENSAFYGCASPSIWVYLNRVCSCFLWGGGCPYTYEPGFSAWSWPRFESASLTYTGSERACPVAVSLVSLKRKESAWKERLVFMMVPEGGYLGKTTSDKPSTSAEEVLSRQKKQARREAKLMLEIESAKKNLKKAQKKQSKAQASLEARNTSLQTLEAKLAELGTRSLEPKSEMPLDSAELERQQVPSESEDSVAHSDGYQQASTLTGAEKDDPVGEETTSSEANVATNEVTEGSEVAGVQDNETATGPAPTPTTPRKAPAQKTVATRKPTATKRPTSSSTAPRRPANGSQSTRQRHSDAE